MSEEKRNSLPTAALVAAVMRQGDAEISESLAALANSQAALAAAEERADALRAERDVAHARAARLPAEEAAVARARLEYETVHAIAADRSKELQEYAGVLTTVEAKAERERLSQTTSEAARDFKEEHERDRAQLEASVKAEYTAEIADARRMSQNAASQATVVWKEEVREAREQAVVAKAATSKANETIAQVEKDAALQRESEALMVEAARSAAAAQALALGELDAARTGLSREQQECAALRAGQAGIARGEATLVAEVAAQAQRAAELGTELSTTRARVKEEAKWNEEAAIAVVTAKLAGAEAELERLRADAQLARQVEAASLGEREELWARDSAEARGELVKQQTRALEAENAEAYATVQLRIELDQEQRASEALLARVTELESALLAEVESAKAAALRTEAVVDRHVSFRDAALTAGVNGLDEDAGALAAAALEVYVLEERDRVAKTEETAYFEVTHLEALLRSASEAAYVAETEGREQAHSAEMRAARAEGTLHAAKHQFAAEVSELQAAARAERQVSEELQAEVARLSAAGSLQPVRARSPTPPPGRWGATVASPVALMAAEIAGRKPTDVQNSLISLLHQQVDLMNKRERTPQKPAALTPSLLPG